MLAVKGSIFIGIVLNVCAVTTTTAKRSVLETKERDFWKENKESPAVVSSVVTSSSSSEDDDEPIAKKKKTEKIKRKKEAAKKAQMKLLSDAKQNITTILSDDDADDDLYDLDREQLISKVRGLQTNVADLKSKLDKLMNLNFKLQEGLYAHVKSAIAEGFASPSRQRMRTDSTSPEMTTSQSESDNNNDSGELTSFLSEGTIFQLRRSSSASRLICSAMTSMFTPEEMATSLVTGHRLKDEDKNRPILDQRKVNAIINFVCNLHPEMSPAIIRNKMGLKCKDTRHSLKRMEQKMKKVSIRLAGSTAPEMGRLEVRINGTWGTVHSSGWGQPEAHVVCNQLGYSSPVGYTPLIAYFGQGTSMPVHMAHLSCTGRETTVLDCQYSMPVDDNHEEDVGVICQPEYTSDYHVRLTDGSSENSGRVEFFLHGTWGSICDKNWILNDATVVCRNLDFAAAVATHASADFGESSEMHLNDVTCLGTESGLRYCRHEVFNTTTAATCSGGRDVGVTCLPKKDLQIRLVGSNSPNEGRIEVLLHDVWSPIINLNTDWELKEGDVVCRSLGFETAYGAVTDGRFGKGHSWLYSMMGVKCMGNETSLEGCVYEIARHDISSQVGIAVGVVCGNKNGNDGDVRLVDGKSANEGRLEIYHYGKWGSICMDGWKSNADQVACKQMGYPSANATIKSIPGPDDQPIHLDDVICSGDEEGLSECQHEDWGIHNCSHSEDVAIKCNRYKDYDVRLVGGQVASEGRVEIFVNNVWGAICDKNWSLSEASVVCRSLGYPSEYVSLCGTGYIASPAPKHFHKMMVKCLDSEANIQNCSTKILGQQHQYNTSVCIRCTTNYEDKQMLLMRGKTANEGVPKVYNADTGQWDFICTNKVTFENNNVICRSMGFAYAKSISGSLITHSTGSTNEYGCFVKDIACKGTEIDVRDCPKVSELILQTNYTTAASIQCNEFQEHSIRLVGGASPREGRLEIYHDGQWGTVCISSWTRKIDAGVVCRSLGLGLPPLNSGVPPTNPGIGPIHLSGVSCNGSENSIADCNHGDWGINRPTCRPTHDYDVMIKCSDPLPNWCGNAFCKDDEICKLSASSGFYCQSTSKKEDSRDQYLAVVLPILVFFVVLACYISARLCHTLPVQPHKECLNLLRRCCGKKPSNYRIVLTASDEIILVENAS